MKKLQNNSGFTLIELLTVVAIIAMLIALFGAGLQKVKIVQRNLQQKAALKAMEVGLELFSKDFQEYPDSAQVSDGSTVVCGAQRLAEALVGRDELGFHPKTKWHPNLDMAAPAPHPGLSLYTSQTQKDRKSPYMEMRRLGVYTIYELWAGNNGGSTIYDSGAVTPNGTHRAPVITDIFNRNRITLPSGDSERAGMPVLYFKADSSKRFRVDASNQPVTNPAESEYKNWVYNFSDNLPMLRLPWLRDPAADTNNDIPPHYPDEDNDGTADNPAQVFYEQLSRRHTPGSNWDKPFNPSTFVLISAGWDGIYGTKDDITNFNY
ncbi:MAG TPA: type II secretion system protein [Anaerohalosphaeraceae bacterium]|nr:type II secretion system protein [Phycisphaerae bacterium]HOL31157.1 type II secretion system protein [Anaerohalosphaeraceae bacterium]HOM75856.1 type II secretion system protein [Anaerohalosphaeraceae bacterium]HPC63484.1 type II secretion system protein [Anaerohalosphaeraceae bacterium]HPO69419.1 type II secretion system protein [Anaerohalosphaeraceae bacterium]